MSPRYCIQQPFQMFAAVTLQAINGILFARLPGLMKRFEVLLAAAVVCLYPAILDTCSFARDHPTFAIGDTLALAARIEEQTAGLYEGKRAIVVIGALPECPYQRYVRYRNQRMQPHAGFTTFPFFRQVELLSFLFGQDVLQLPTAAQVERATASTKDRKPWPSADAV